MIAFAFVAAAALILSAIFVAETFRARAKRKLLMTPRSIARRQPHLEDAIRAAFDGPAAKHGEIFQSYSIWKREHETRLELIGADAFGALNEFTRCLIVRHLWRALERLSKGSVVIVDNPPQRWSESIDEVFHDYGIDPWTVPVASLLTPHFAKE